MHNEFPSLPNHYHTKIITHEFPRTSVDNTGESFLEVSGTSYTIKKMKSGHMNAWNGDLCPAVDATNKHDENSQIYNIKMFKTGQNQTLNDSLSIKQQLDIVMNHPQQGIPAEDIRAILKYAKENNLIIGIRPVEPLARTLLAENYPTKGYAIKGKSANWGPMAGFIPVEQKNSKLEAEPAQVVENFSKQVAAVIKKGIASAVDLTISERRYNELVEKGMISVCTTDDNKIITLQSRGPSGKMYNFFAQQDGNGQDKIYYHIFDAMKKPVQVVASQETKQALVADYDLLFVSPAMADMGNVDRIPISLVSHRNFTSHIRYPENLAPHSVLKQWYDHPEEFYAAADPNFGIGSQRVKDTVTGLNKALGHSHPRFQHAADESNPKTEPYSNYSAILFFPKPIAGIGQLCLVENKEQFAEVIQIILDSGYHVFRNPEWEEAVTAKRRTSFTKARDALEKHLAEQFQNIKRAANRWEVFSSPEP